MKNVTGVLEISNFAIRLLIHKPKKGNLFTNNVYTVECKETFFDNEILDEDLFLKKIEKLIERAQKELNINLESITLVLNHPQIKTESIERSIQFNTPKIINEAFINNIQDRIEEQINDRFTNDVCIETYVNHILADGIDITKDPVGFKASEVMKLKTSFVLFPKKYLDKIKSLIETVIIVDKVNVPSISNSSLITKTQKKIGVILLDIGENLTSISAWKNGSLIFLKTKKTGVSEVINKIAIREKISLEEARELYIDSIDKDSNVTNHQKENMDRTFKLILTEVLTLLKEIDDDILFPSGVVLTGGGSYYKNILELTKRIFNLNSSFLGGIEITNYLLPQRFYSVLYGETLLTVDKKRNFSFKKFLKFN